MLRIATRGSALARWQAEAVAAQLGAADPDRPVELVVVSTVGDRRHDVAITELGGQGVFVKEVQAAVLDGRADLAVHSAKDLPAQAAAGLRIAAIPPRADPRDALVGVAFDELGPGAVVATGSVRRRAQLAWLRPDLTFAGLRGNIATRLDRCPEGGAMVVALAALDRLGLAHRASWRFAPEVMLPQVGQGAMAVECREDDALVGAALAGIDDPTAHTTVTAERAFLAQLGSGCDLPVGAHARITGDSIVVEGLIASADGRILLRGRRSGPVTDPVTVGAGVADDLVDRAGAGPLLGAGPAPGGARDGAPRGGTG